MDLQIAILLVGVAVIALVVVASVFPSIGERLRSLFAKARVKAQLKSKGQDKGKDKASEKSAARNALIRSKGRPPRLDGDDAMVLGGEQLIDSEETLFDTPESLFGEKDSTFDAALTNDNLFSPPPRKTSAGPAPSVASDQEKAVVDEAATAVHKTVIDRPIHSANASLATASVSEERETPSQISPEGAAASEVSLQRQDTAEPSDQQGQENGQALLKEDDIDQAETARDQDLAQEIDPVQSDDPQSEADESIDLTSADHAPPMQINPTAVFTSLRQIDYWAKLSCDEAHTRETINRYLGSNWQVRGAQTSIHALNVQDRQWVNLDQSPAQASFKEIVISFPLLNQGQPVLAATLSQFAQQIDRLATQLGASLQLLAPTAEAAIQSTNLASLYANCQDHVEAVIKAPEDEQFYTSLIQTSARLQGLVFHRGVYARTKQMGPQVVALYYMTAADGRELAEGVSDNVTIPAVRFVMQPATCENPGTVVKEMLDSAKAFASRVKGELQLVEGTEYHQDQLCQIRDHVSKIESKMQQYGIPAGSAEAVRLFS